MDAVNLISGFAALVCGKRFLVSSLTNVDHAIANFG